MQHDSAGQTSSTGERVSREADFKFNPNTLTGMVDTDLGDPGCDLDPSSPYLFAVWRACVSACACVSQNQRGGPLAVPLFHVPPWIDTRQSPGGFACLLVIYYATGCGSRIGNSARFQCGRFGV